MPRLGVKGYTAPARSSSWVRSPTRSCSTGTRARPESAVARPLKELRGFRRITLAPGETVSVELTLDAPALSHWDADARAWVVEPGIVEVMVGRSSRDADLGLRRTILVRP